MRRVIDRDRLLQFIHDVGRDARTEATIYLTGGATALLFGWRATTIDIDMKIDPETSDILRALPELKERYEINVELAAPEHFIPALPQWRERSLFIERAGRVTFRHYDFYSQALSKLERGHARDTTDVDAMVAAGVVEPAELLRLYEAIEPELYRYPAISPATFRRTVEAYVRSKQ
ncbi:MAG TPA: DUF6036 family nucleotidyltransferase [Thermoanaerobaculia bacterium]|nr:DUF6036 family nucleotidyltransferase [Thermoanaerobaculia bacterium]